MMQYYQVSIDGVWWKAESTASSGSTSKNSPPSQSQRRSKFPMPDKLR